MLSTENFQKYSKRLNATLLILFFLTSASICELRSQDYIKYYNLIWRGIDLKYSGQYEKADSIYDHALSLVMPRAHDLYTSGILKIKLGDKEGGVQRFKQVASVGGFNPTAIILRDYKEIFDSFGSEEWETLDAELNTIASNTIDFLNLPHVVAYRDTARIFIERDQKYRSLYEGDLDEGEKFRQMHVNDSILQVDYFEFIKERGFARHVDETFYAVLYHLTKENYLNYKTLIFEEVKKGNLDPFWFAAMSDRIERILFDNECYFGIWGDCSDREDSKEIIERRISYGLHPYFNGPFRTYQRTVNSPSYKPYY